MTFPVLSSSWFLFNLLLFKRVAAIKFKVTRSFFREQSYFLVSTFSLSSVVGFLLTKLHPGDKTAVYRHKIVIKFFSKCSF